MCWQLGLRQSLVLRETSVQALVLQTIGDLYLRYASFITRSEADAPVIATWTRDMRDDHYATAQILVTVPELLEILLESPGNAEWCGTLSLILTASNCAGGESFVLFHSEVVN